MFIRMRYFLAGLLILICATGVYLLHATKQKAERAEVAIVNGVKIFYDDIRADRQVIALSWPAEVNEPELRASIRKHEIRRFLGKIRDVIFKQKVAELGITVAEEEIDARVEEIFEKTGITDEKANAICEGAQRLYEALAAWHKNPTEGEAIYNEKLAGSVITGEQWKLFQQSYETPEKLRSMIVPKTIDDMKKNSRESSKSDVLQKKLEDVITREVSVSIEEIERAYVERYGPLVEKPPFQHAVEKVRSELLVKKKQEAVRLWWLKQYRQADIEIIDPRFQNVLSILRSGGGVPTL